MRKTSIGLSPTAGGLYLLQRECCSPWNIWKSSLFCLQPPGRSEHQQQMERAEFTPRSAGICWSWRSPAFRSCRSKFSNSSFQLRSLNRSPCQQPSFTEVCQRYLSIFASLLLFRSSALVHLIPAMACSKLLDGEQCRAAAHVPAFSAAGQFSSPAADISPACIAVLAFSAGPQSFS